MEGRQKKPEKFRLGKAGEQAAVDKTQEKERGNRPRRAKCGEDSRDWQGSMGTQAIAFQAGSGFMSLQQTGQLISPVIMIPHSQHRHNNCFKEGCLVIEMDWLEPHGDGELSKGCFGTTVSGLQSHLQTLVNA